MSFALHAVSDKPQGLWMLDDDSPFQDHSGFNRTADAGTAPTRHLSLAKGAVDARVFDRTRTGRFQSPVFQRGMEDKPFTLEATIRHIKKTVGYTAQQYRENLISNPSVETSLNGWGLATTATLSRATDRAHVGTASVGVTTAGASGDGAYFIAVSPFVSGESYTLSGFVYIPSSIPSISASLRWQNSSGATLGSDIISQVTSPATGSWQKISVTATAPVGADRVLCMFRIYAVHTALTFNVDAVMLEKSTTPGTYFDGSMPGYEWAGTAHSSVSRTRTDVSLVNTILNPSMGGATTQSVYRQNIAWTETNPPSNVVNTTFTNNVSYDGTTWTRMTNTSTTAAANARKRVNLSNLQNGRQYVASWEVANDTASSVSVSVDWCDGGVTTYTIAAGKRMVVSASASRETYDDVYRFTDLQLNTFNTSVLFREIIVELGTAYQPYFDGGTTPATFNLAKNRPVSVNGGAYGVSAATDGRVNGAVGASWHGAGDPGQFGTPANAIVDLGSKKLLDRVIVWHYYNDGRTYYNTKTQVSADGTNWTTIYDSAVSGTYQETAAGKTINFTRQYVRYIRDYVGGNTVNSGAHWTEIMAFDTASEFNFMWSGTAFASNSLMRAGSTSNWSNVVGGVSGVQLQMQEGNTRFTRFLHPANQQAAQYRVIFGSLDAAGIEAGSTLTLIIRARGGGGYENISAPSTILRSNGLNGVGNSWGTIPLSSSWQTFTRTMTALATPGQTNMGFYWSIPTAATSEDSWVDIEYILVSKGSVSTYFDGNTPGAGWSGTTHASPSMMYISSGKQKVLSHASTYDGITVEDNMVRFGTEYAATGSAVAEYEMQDNETIHIVGVHTDSKNSLYINGTLMDEVDITPEQQADQFVLTDGYLYAGQSPTGTGVAMNGAAVYSRAFQDEEVARHYEASRITTSVEDVASGYGASQYPIDLSNTEIFSDQLWNSNESWAAGEVTNVAISDGVLYPSFEGTVSTPGTWLDSFAIASAPDKVYAVVPFWTGSGVKIEASLDGATWETLQRNRKINLIPENFDPTDEVLQVRVTFAGGIENDTSHLESLNLVGIASNVTREVMGRKATFTGVTPLRSRNALELSDDWGAVISPTGSIAVSASTADSPAAVRSIEVWGRHFGGAAPSISVTGTQYVDGLTTNSIVTGQWHLIHVVSASDIGAFTISGDFQVGAIILHQQALTAAQITNIVSRYAGTNSLRVNENTPVGIAETVGGPKIYAHEWTIESAG